jgi:hypothetical protein
VHPDHHPGSFVEEYPFILAGLPSIKLQIKNWGSFCPGVFHVPLNYKALSSIRFAIRDKLQRLRLEKILIFGFLRKRCRCFPRLHQNNRLV